MAFFLDILLAWVAMGLGGLLVIIFLLRVINKKFFNNEKNVIYKINKFLRKHHKTIGLAIIIAGFFHGLFSSKGLLVIGLGMIVWIITILLALTFVFKKQLKKIKNWYYWHRVLALLFVGILVWHIVDVGGFVGVKTAYQLSFNQTREEIAIREPISSIDPVEQSETPVAVEQSETPVAVEQSEIPVPSETGVLYKDGVYTGIADGFGPNLTVEVTIENGLISDVSVISHNEQKSQFYAKPIAEIPVAIVKSQTPLVDTVSGATYTSTGIINATIDALEDAKINN